MKGLNRIKSFFTKGHSRTILAKKNIATSIGIKGVSILISFLLVPLTLDYLNPTKYGIWLTLSSVVGWLSFFDIGLGNGLRNKLAEAFAIKDMKLAKNYVSTTYLILTLIMGGVFVLFLIINPFLNWASLLNTAPEMATELGRIVLIVFTFFSLLFVLKLIGTILTAAQLPAYNNAFNSLASLISLISIYIITKISNDSLLYISIVYSAAPVVVFIVASFYFFKGKYKLIKPSLASVDFKYLKPLAGLGVKFFVLRISVLVIFSTDNMIITRILGPAEVTPYNIAYKYFGIPIMAFSILLSPFWSAYTDAITLNESKWIKRSINKLIKIWLIFVGGIVIMVIISNQFYVFWIGDKIKIPLLLSFFMAIYALMLTWSQLFVNFINGVGKIKLQMYYGIIAMIINIPASIFFARNLGMGSAGVILGTCTSLVFGFVLSPIQYYKIINNRAKGIWDK